MKGIRISKNDEIKVLFALGNLKNGKLVGDISSDSLKETFSPDLDETTIEEHFAIFRRPSFGDVVAINGATKINTSDGVSVNFNPLEVRMVRMQKLIKSWSLKDEDGTDIPATPEEIKNIDQVVANIIGIQLDATVSF